MGKNPQSWKPSTAVLLAALLLGVACERKVVNVVQEIKPNPPPITGGALGPLVPGAPSLRKLRAYADSLEFNTNLGLADQELADFVRDTVGRGDTVRVEPVSGAHLFDSTELAQGRIVARIWSRQEFRRAGFGPWWTYWWIDRNGQGGTWRTVFISPATASADTTWFGRYPPGRKCPADRTCAAIHNGSSVIICYDCGGTWCATKPVLATTP